MLKNEKRKKKRNKNRKKTEKNTTKKYNLKSTTEKNTTKKRERPKKGVGERGGGAHIKNICPEFLPESFSFLFMKLYRNVYQIKTMCRIQLWLHFLYLFRGMAL